MDVPILLAMGFISAIHDPQIFIMTQLISVDVSLLLKSEIASGSVASSICAHVEHWYIHSTSNFSLLVSYTKRNKIDLPEYHKVSKTMEWG